MSKQCIDLVYLITHMCKFMQNDTEHEQEGWQACCVDAIDMCGQFYKGRPYSDGEDYVFPVLCKYSVFTFNLFCFVHSGLTV